MYGDNLEAQKLFPDPLNGPYWPPTCQKMKNFNSELEENLEQYFDVKFDEEPEFDSFEDEKLSRDPLNDSLLGPKSKDFQFCARSDE